MDDYSGLTGTVERICTIDKDAFLIACDNNRDVWGVRHRLEQSDKPFPRQ